MKCTRIGIIAVIAVVAAACHRGVDKQKFDAVYRDGKTLAVQLESSNVTQIAESRKLVQQLRTDVSIIENRLDRDPERAAVQAYKDAAEAIECVLNVRSMDLRGETDRDGRLLVGEGWAPKAQKFGVPIEARPRSAGDTIQWYSMETGIAFKTFLDAGNRKLSDAARIVDDGR